MDQSDAKRFADRWRLVKLFEDEELKNASMEITIQQMLSIWEISRTLDFQQLPEPPDHSWQTLQRKWLEKHG